MVMHQAWRGQTRTLHWRRCSTCHRQHRGRLAAERRGEVWDESRKVDGRGYVWVWQNGKWVAEHRAVMEEALGRELRLGESVHHRNGKRADNQRENLDLRITGVKRGLSADGLTCPHCQEPYFSPM